MKVLVACEESQAVTKELRTLGHEAYSCDIIPCSGGHPEWHIQGDVLQLLYPDVLICSLEPDIEDEMFGTFKTMDGIVHELPPKWDMIIGFPPCTYLSNAGACRLYPKAGQLDMDRYAKGIEARAFFMKIYNADCPHIAVENPVSSKVFQMPPHSQEIQPYEFGHPYTKKTRLWLKGLPNLKPTNTVTPVSPYVPSLTSRKMKDKYGKAKRGQDSINRSKTFQGIAEAMAKQWTEYIEGKSNDQIEGQLSFSDLLSFDRYIETYRKEEISCGN